MPKTYQMMKMNVFGKRFVVVFHAGTNDNPFWLYQESTDFDKDGWRKEHKRVIAKYQNFESCLYHLLQMDNREFKYDCFKTDI